MPCIFWVGLGEAGKKVRRVQRRERVGKRRVIPRRLLVEGWKERRTARRCEKGRRWYRNMESEWLVSAEEDVG